MASEDATIDGMDYWATRWKEQRTGWHLSEVHPNLTKYVDRLAKFGESKKFFLPLCGQTYDIQYLHGLGHKVFAIEGVKEVIDGLNERDNLKLQFNPDESTFLSEDGQIVIYVGDVLECPIEKWGPVDCVWDRASLIAMNYAQRRGYVDMIKRSVMKSKDEYSDFRILLETVCYPKALFPGPPRSVDQTDMKELFGEWTKIESLEKVDADITFPMLRKQISTEYEAVTSVYLLTPK